MPDLDTDTLCGCGCLPDCEECLTLVIKAGQPAVYLCECEDLDTCYCDVPGQGPARYHNYGVII